MLLRPCSSGAWLSLAFSTALTSALVKTTTLHTVKVKSGGGGGGLDLAIKVLDDVWKMRHRPQDVLQERADTDYFQDDQPPGRTTPPTSASSTLNWTPLLPAAHSEHNQQTGFGAWLGSFNRRFFADPASARSNDTGDELTRLASAPTRSAHLLDSSDLEPLSPRSIADVIDVRPFRSTRRRRGDANRRFSFPKNSDPNVDHDNFRIPLGGYEQRFPSGRGRNQQQLGFPDFSDPAVEGRQVAGGEDSSIRGPQDFLTESAPPSRENPYYPVGPGPASYHPDPDDRSHHGSYSDGPRLYLQPDEGADNYGRTHQGGPPDHPEPYQDHGEQQAPLRDHGDPYREYPEQQSSFRDYPDGPLHHEQHKGAGGAYSDHPDDVPAEVNAGKGGDGYDEFDHQPDKGRGRRPSPAQDDYYFDHDFKPLRSPAPGVQGRPRTFFDDFSGFYTSTNDFQEDRLKPKPRPGPADYEQEAEHDLDDYPRKQSGHKQGLAAYPDPQYDFSADYDAPLGPGPQGGGLAPSRPSLAMAHMPFNKSPYSINYGYFKKRNIYRGTSIFG